MKNIDGVFVGKKECNQLMKKKHEKVCTTLNCIEHFLILASLVSGCLSISAFASLERRSMIK